MERLSGQRLGRDVLALVVQAAGPHSADTPALTRAYETRSARFSGCATRTLPLCITGYDPPRGGLARLRAVAKGRRAQRRGSVVAF